MRVQKWRRVVLVGHSFGTSLALKLASEEGGKVAALVLIGAYVPGSSKRPRLFSLARWLFYLPNWVCHHFSGEE